MTKITESSNLPAASMPWARQVTDGFNTLDLQVQRFTSDQTNLNRGNNTNIQRLVSQAAAIQQTQQDLATQQGQLAAQQAYQASLITVGDSGKPTYNSGDIPGDQTQRWTASGNKVTLRVPTGKASVRFGVGQLTMQSGNSSMIGYLRVHLTTADGSYDTTWGQGTRFFLTSNSQSGIPISTERAVENIPTDKDVTCELEYGTWSAATGPLSNMQFAAGYITVQVVPA